MMYIILYIIFRRVYIYSGNAPRRRRKNITLYARVASSGFREHIISYNILYYYRSSVKRPISFWRRRPDRKTYEYYIIILCRRDPSPTITAHESSELRHLPLLRFIIYRIQTDEPAAAVGAPNCGTSFGPKTDITHYNILFRHTKTNNAVIESHSNI